MVLQELQQGATIDTSDFELPDGVQLPMSSDEEIQIMEEALETGLFRKRLVSEPCQFLNSMLCYPEFFTETQHYVQSTE